MSKYIRIEDAIHAAISGCADWDGGYFPSMDGPIEDAFKDQGNKCIEIVRCRECKHYNAGFECLVEGYGIERDPDWFCADGEREVQDGQ